MRTRVVGIRGIQYAIFYDVSTCESSAFLFKGCNGWSDISNICELNVSDFKFSPKIYGNSMCFQSLT